MSDTEAAPEPAKAKRTMTPEARERMLANLAKGREAKLKKLSEAKKIRDEENDKKLRDLGVSEPMNARLTCPGCRKVFKHSSTKSTHVKKCKFIASNNKPLPSPENDQKKEEPTPTPTPKPGAAEDASEPEPSAKPKRKRRQKVTIIESESESESSSSSSEEELIVRRKKSHKARARARARAAPAPAPAPVRPQPTQSQIRAYHEEQKVKMLAKAMSCGGLM